MFKTNVTLMSFLACDTPDTYFAGNKNSSHHKNCSLLLLPTDFLPFTPFHCVFIKILEEKEEAELLAISATLVLTLFNKLNNLHGLILTYGCAPSVNQGDFL